MVSTHSRPKAAAKFNGIPLPFEAVSTHSRPKAAAQVGVRIITTSRFQHTAARRRLPKMHKTFARNTLFQHTAARRRLQKITQNQSQVKPVSTHSRPKAAAQESGHILRRTLFQHTAARRRLHRPLYLDGIPEVFQHTAARRRLRVRRI